MDVAVERKDIYSAVLMNMLESSFSVSIVDEKFEDSVNLFKKFTSSMSSLLKEEYKINIYDAKDFKNLTAEQKKSLSKHASDWFDAKFPGWMYSEEAFKGIMAAFDTVGSIEDYYNRIVSCAMLNQIGEEMKAVLHQAYQDSGNTGNLALRLALMDCVGIVEASVGELTLKMVNENLTAVGVNATKWVFEEVLWKDITSSFYALHPAAAVLMATYKAVSFGVNQMLSTDKIREQYIKMLAVEDIENLFDETYDNLKKKFVDSQSVEAAGAYLAAIDFSYHAKDNDCDEAYEFVDIVDTATISKLLQAFGASDASTTKKAIRDIQSAYKNGYENNVKGSSWIGFLEEDYPGSGLYEYYDELYSRASNNPTVKKQLTAACPVDVYIYSKGELVASSVGGVVSCSSDNISVIGIGDEKTFLFYDDQDYDVKYVGSDTGTMDITIQEFDENEAATRTVNYYDVALEKEKTYEMPVKGENLSASSYKLTEETSSDAVEPGYDSLAENAVSYRAVVEHGSMDYQNRVFFETDIHVGESVALHACVPEGFSFVKWQSAAGDIFEDATSADTTFRMPGQDVKITAVIKESRVSKISVTAPSKKIAAGKKVKLATKISPKAAANQKVTWKSSNKKYATVNAKGVVTTKKAGAGKIVTITATAKDGSGVKGTVKIKIMKNAVTKIKITNAKKTLSAGKSMLLKAVVTTNGKKANKDVKWTVSNSKYATVNSKGKVTAKKAGKGKTVTVAATSKDGTNKKAKVKIRIK